MKSFCPGGKSSSATGCPKRLWHPHIWGSDKT